MMQTMHFEISHSHSDLPIIKEQFNRRAKLSQKGENHKAAAQGNAIFPSGSTTLGVLKIQRGSWKPASVILGPKQCHPAS